MGTFQNLGLAPAPSWGTCSISRGPLHQMNVIAKKRAQRTSGWRDTEFQPFLLKKIQHKGRRKGFRKKLEKEHVLQCRPVHPFGVYSF
eukprot:818870-Pelagomonas_calceolata.AAC.1